MVNVEVPIANTASKINHQKFIFQKKNKIYRTKKIKNLKKSPTIFLNKSHHQSSNSLLGDTYSQLNESLPAAFIVLVLFLKISFSTNVLCFRHQKKKTKKTKKNHGPPKHLVHPSPTMR